MPGDNGVANAAKLKHRVWRRRRSQTEPELLRCPHSGIPEPYRENLRVLFSQIEAEFEKLYAENLQLHEQVSLLSKEQVNNIDKTDSPEQIDPSAHKNAKKSGSQISQKIKSTYKTSTTKFANTFKSAGQSGCRQMVKVYSSHTDGVWEVGVSHREPRVLGTASADYTAKIWCIESGAVILQYYGHHGSVNSIRFHPTSDLVLTASGDQTAHIWRASIPNSLLITENGKPKKLSSDEDTDQDDREEVSNAHFIHAPIQAFVEHSNVVVAADWLAGGEQIVTGSWDSSAVVFNVETGTPIETLTGHENALTNVTCHSTLPLALTSSKDSSVRLWDLRDQSVKVNAFVGHSASVSSAVFASSNKIVSGSDDRTVKCWDMRNMATPYTTIRSDSPVNRLSVSANGIIAVPHDNRHVRLYDLNGVRLGRLTRNNHVGHTRMVSSAAWNDETGSICNLFTAGFEKRVLGWSVTVKPSDSKDKLKAVS
ncbi:WD repeat-containing protein 37-like [Watersipora subatra]|uniref:WD repeat-containing protein 37-like n=1 Tax=Watersipora subatra TaxID=2589382 RepID=UPI00355BA7B7